MAAIAKISIDLTKIDKSRVVTKKDKKGVTRKYLYVDVKIHDEINNYNQNVSAYHTQSKEERLAKEEKDYLGNGRVTWAEGGVEVVPYDKPAVAKTEAVTEDLDF